MVRATSTLATGTARRRPSAFTAPGYRLVLVAGWLWQMARWGVSFVGAFLANDLTGSARLVQLTGVALWAPLLLGGIIGGVVSDRFDRRRTVIRQFMVMVPATLALGALSAFGRLELWMIYPFMVSVGISWVIDMTSRRALIYDLVGAARIDHAMSLEMLSSASGLAVGALLGGAVIEALGIAAAFVTVAIMFAGALVLFVLVPQPPEPELADAPAEAADVVGGLGMLRSERMLLSVLGVTAAVNLFFFSFSPLIQVVGAELDVGPSLLGLLAGMLGLGMMTGAVLMLRLRPVERGKAYVLGSLMAFTFALGFVATNSYVITAGALFLAAVGMGFFGATQGVLTMASVGDSRRGRALGLLSMAIGVLPIGMISLGELAEVIGARLAIAVFVTAGALVCVLWVWHRPEVLGMRSTD